MNEQDSRAALSEEEERILERYAAPSLSAQERRELEQRILSSPSLAEAVYADESLRAAFEESTGGSRIIPIDEARRRRGRSAWLRFAIPIAAGALFIALTPRFFGDRTADDGEPPPAETERRLRSPSPSPSSAPPSTVAGLFPYGTFGEPPAKFIWTRSPQATAYRLELMNESGTPIFSTETAETTLALPVDHPSWSQVGSWRVTPLTGASAGAPSDPVRMRVDPSLGQ